jgi:UDP-N-acetylmuramate--alanine ligase
MPYTLDADQFLHTRNACISPQIVRAIERPSAHLVGICGSGMKSLAAFLLDLGWSISGSDLNPSESCHEWFRARGIDLQKGHAPHHIPWGAKLLIYSAAVPDDNAERVAARSLEIPEQSYSQALGALMRSRRGIGIAGTHGKSTTAAMTATVLRSSGREPSACIGAELCGLDTGGWAGEGDLFVAECCEFRRSFLDLAPKSAAILNIEGDHFDYFHSLAETREAFRQFASRVPPEGLLVVRADCLAAVEARTSAGADALARIETFSLQSPASWLAENLRPTQTGIGFDATYRGARFGRFELRVPGRHNVLNAIASIALCHEIGLQATEIQAGLAEFRGIRRRFEHLGTPNGVVWIDDFAHHPTEVRATLEEARQRYGSRRIWCLFQPHQVSRLRALLPDFATSFQRADQILIAPVFAAREIRGDEANALARHLAEEIGNAGGVARFCPDLDRIVATVDDEARAGDVVISMGAGDINRVYHAYTRRLQRNLAS